MIRWKMKRNGDNTGKSSALMGFKIIALDELDNDTYYWMMDSSKKNAKYGIQYKEGKGIFMRGPEMDDKTEVITYTAGFDGTYGFNDARGWVGSKGTNLA